MVVVDIMRIRNRSFEPRERQGDILTRCKPSLASRFMFHSNRGIRTTHVIPDIILDSNLTWKCVAEFIWKPLADQIGCDKLKLVQVGAQSTNHPSDSVFRGIHL